MIYVIKVSVTIFGHVWVPVVAKLYMTRYVIKPPDLSNMYNLKGSSTAFFFLSVFVM